MSKSKIGEPQTVNVANILSDYNFIRIPDYQRHYTWETLQVAQFFEDIIQDVSKFSPKTNLDAQGQSLNKARTTVFGTTIGMEGPEIELKKDNPKKHKLYFDIIDGQQRLATLSILVLCLQHFARKHKNDTRRLEDELGNMRKFLVREPIAEIPQPYFEFNYNDREYWANLIKLVYDERGDNHSYGKLDLALERSEQYLTENKDKKTKLHDAVWEMYKRLVEYLDNSIIDKKGKSILYIWEWISATRRYGLRFTKIVEADINTALIRFDRENNRGLPVTLDDLAKSYLIEAVERNNSLDDEEKANKKSVILENWKVFQANSGSLQKEKIIQWYLLMRTGYSKIKGPTSVDGKIVMTKMLRHNLNINTIGMGSNDNNYNAWDPVKISEEIAAWVRIYGELTKDRPGYKEKTYYNLKYLKKLKAPWPFVISLAVACSQHEIKSCEVNRDLANLPVNIISMIEYCTITQTISGSYKQNRWEDKYKHWTAWIGRYVYNLDHNEVMFRSTVKATEEGHYEYDNIDSLIKILEGEIISFNESDSDKGGLKSHIGFEPFDFNDFLKRYLDVFDAGGFAGTRMDHRKKAAHYRILVQAEYHLKPDRSFVILDNEVKREGKRIQKGIELEHIFPSSDEWWKADKEIYDNDKLNAMRLVRNSVGNHTLVSARFNNLLSNRKFIEKQWGRSDLYGDEAEECYNKSSLDIASSLCNDVCSPWSAHIIRKRAEILLKTWGLYSPNNVNKPDVQEDDLEMLKPDGNPQTRSINSLVTRNESPVFEFKAGYWADDGAKKGETAGTYNDKLETKDLVSRVNATVNAFANTQGGDIILGRFNDEHELDEISGIDPLVKFYERKFEKIGKSKEDAHEMLINDISDDLRRYYRKDEYPLASMVWCKKLKTGKYVIHIKVPKYDNQGKEGFIPFHVKSDENNEDLIDSSIFFLRNAAHNISYDINAEKDTFYEKVEDGKVVASTQLSSVKVFLMRVLINKQKNNKQVWIGPFTSEQTAKGYLRKLKSQNIIDETNIPRTESKQIFERDFADNPDLYQMAIGLQKNKDWEAGKSSCFIISLLNLDIDWKLNTNNIEMKTDVTTEMEEGHIVKNQRHQVRDHIMQFTTSNNTFTFEREALLLEGKKTYMKEWKTKTPGQTLSRILQELRDKGELEFLKKGLYRIK